MEGQKDGGKKGEREERKGNGKEEMSQWEIQRALPEDQQGAQATSQVTVEGQITE